MLFTDALPSASGRPRVCFAFNRERTSPCNIAEATTGMIQPVAVKNYPGGISLSNAPPFSGKPTPTDHSHG
jgi:hypothetical protein